MHLQGIEKVTLTALDLESARQFYLDWGLSLKEDDANALLFESLNGAQVGVHASTDVQLPKGIEKDPTLREVTWCVSDAAALDHFRTQLSSLSSFEDHAEVIKCKDPSGLSLAIVLSQKKELHENLCCTEASLNLCTTADL